MRGSEWLSMTRLLCLALSFAALVACGGGGGGGSSGGGGGGGDGSPLELDPDKDFFLVGASFARPIFDVGGGLDQAQPLVNPASLHEVDPLTGAALAGFPKVLNDGAVLPELSPLSFEQIQDPLTPQVPLVPRNAAVVLDFTRDIDLDSLNLVTPPPGTDDQPAGVIGTTSTVQVQTKAGALVQARALLDPTDASRLVLIGVGETGLGWDASPLLFDSVGTVVPDPTGYLRVVVGVGAGALTSADGVLYSDRPDGLGTEAEPLPFNPGNAQLDAIVLQTDDGQITFNGFLPDLSTPRIIRPVTSSGVLTNIVGTTLEDDQLVSLPNVAANGGDGEWANAVITITSSTVSGPVETQYVVERNENVGSVARYVLAAGQTLDPVVQVSDTYEVSRTEYFEPIPGPLPADPFELARITVDPDNVPRDPLDPQDAFNSDLRYFVRMFDPDGVERLDRWNAATQTFLPVPPKTSIELTFSEPMSEEGFRPYETLFVKDAAVPASDPAFRQMRLGRTAVSTDGRSVRFDPVLEDQYFPDESQFVGFGGTASVLKLVVRTLPEAADLKSLLDGATPDVEDQLLDLDTVGVQGCTDLGGRGLGLPAALLDQSDSENFLLLAGSPGQGALPPAVDFAMEFETLATEDPDYGVIVHRFMGQATTSIFSYPEGSVHDQVTQGVEYYDFPAVDEDDDGDIDRRFIYGPTLLEVGLNAPGRLTGGSAETIEHLIDQFNAPKQSGFASPNGEDFLISVGFGLSVPINSGFGARFQHIYRAGDASPAQSTFRGAILDLVGLAWAPFNGNITNTTLDGMAIRVGLSGANNGRGPNTNQTNGIPSQTNSGLGRQFDCNQLDWHDNCNNPPITGTQLVAALDSQPPTTEVVKKGTPYQILSSGLFAPANATGLASGFNQYLDFPAFNSGIDPIFGRDDVFSFPYDSQFPMLLEYAIEPNEAVPSSLNLFSFSPGILSSALPRFRVWSQGQHPTAHCVPNWSLGVGPGPYGDNQVNTLWGGEGGPLVEPGCISQPIAPPDDNNGMPVIPVTEYILPPRSEIDGTSNQPEIDREPGQIQPDDNQATAGCITKFPVCNSDPDTNWYFANGMLINPLPNFTAYPGPTGAPPTFYFGYGVPLAGAIGTPGALNNSPPCLIPFNLAFSNQINPPVASNEPSWLPAPANYGDNSRYYMMWKYRKRVSVVESPTILIDSAEEGVQYLRPVMDPPLDQVDPNASLKLEIKAGSLLDFSIPQLDSGFVDAGATEFTTDVSGFGNDRRFVKFRASFGVAQGATTPPAIDTIVIPYVKVDP